MTETRKRRRGSQYVSASAAQTLDAWIASSRYPIHSRLPPERELATILKISRGKLREALEQLENEGKIWRHVGVGTYVGGRPASIHASLATLSVATTLAEILEARLEIEPIVARFAAVRAERAEIAMIQKYLALGLASDQWAAWEEWDQRFHRAIAEASGNGILINIIDHIFQIKTHRRWTVKTSSDFKPELIRKYSEEHAELLKAISDNNPSLAESAMRRHIMNLKLTIGPIITGRNLEN